MKKLLSAVAVLLLSGLAYAEPSHGSRGQFFGQLDLTEEQRDQIQEIRKNGGDRDEIRAVLNADQQAKLKDLRGGVKERRGPNIDRMKEKLDLSDDQVTEMRGIVEAGGSREDVQAVLNDEQRAKFDQRREHHKKNKKGKKDKGSKEDKEDESGE